MPIEPQVDQRILDNVNELIQKWTDFVPSIDSHTHSHATEYERLRMNTYGLVKMVCGNTTHREEFLDRLKKAERENSTKGAVKMILGILMGLKDNYDKGFLEELENWIVAELSSNYLWQAEELLDEGKRSSIGHLPAAVLCGAVLEDALRQLCARHSPPIDTKKQNGQPRRLNALIDELQNAKVFNPMKGDLLRSWAKTRNHAAHGEFNEFERSDVDAMLVGVKTFLADNL